MSANSQLADADWGELDRRLRPRFLNHVAQMRLALSYGCIRQAYAHTMPEASAYATGMLGGDPKHRYDAWLSDLTAAYRCLGEHGVTGYADLVERISTMPGVAMLLAETGMPVDQFAGLSYLLRYWVIPQQHPARELIDPEEPTGKEYIQRLKLAGVGGSLDLLEMGRTAAGRHQMATNLGIPDEFITAVVHRADLRRLPYHSRKTISHLIGAGAGSIAALAAIDPQTLAAQVLAYGRTMGKDLHYGVEPIMSALIARILPPIVV